MGLGERGRVEVGRTRGRGVLTTLVPRLGCQGGV